MTAIKALKNFFLKLFAKKKNKFDLHKDNSKKTKQSEDDIYPIF